MAGRDQPRDARRDGSRIPPHNLDAEASVLGAMLLSADAIGVVSESGLTPGDFYRPAHQHIFDAIRSLYTTGEPIDSVTVAEALRRAALLDEVGGAEALNELQNATPAISGAKHYAKIVADTSMLRRMIRAASDIAELAYGGPDDVIKAVDQAESTMFEIGDSRIVDSTRPIKDLITTAMDRLEEAYERGSAITGAPSGYHDLDELLSGLQPSTLNIVGARPAMGKCVAWDTPIVDVVTGEVVTAARLLELAAERGVLDLPALDESGRLGARGVSACIDDGVKPVFTVRTRSGRSATITGTHPLLTAHGWRPLADVHVGEHIAMPTTLPFFGADDLPDEEIDLLALLIGDGSIGSGATPRLTTASADVLSIAATAAATYGLVLTKDADAGKAITWRISCGRRGGNVRPKNPVTTMLMRHGLWGTTSHDKRLPTAVFRLPRNRLARFLNRLFATDGTAWVATAGYARIGYASVSEQLVSDVAHALLRYGIRTKVRERSVKYAGTRHRSFEIEIMDARSMRRFIDEIGILGKEAALGRVLQVVDQAKIGWSLDTVPTEVWDDILKAKDELSWAEISRRCGRPSSHNWHQSRRGPLRRETVAQLAEALDDDRLRWWASPDIGWDRIVSIEPLGETQVIDFTVPEHHNFVAADLYLHNTAFGMGMATNIAKTTHQPVLVFSLEMGHDELTQRILASEAKVDSSKLRTGRLNESDWARIGQAIGRLEVPLFLDDNPQLTVMEIRAKARRIKARHGSLALIVVDYIQLMTGGGSAENRQLEVSEISRNLKILARELEVPIVALSQLSRNLEARADKRPMLSDLRESGSLEQDADVVMFLYRDEVYNAESPDKGSAEVIVAKHRSGPIGTKRLVWLGQYTRFENAARRSDL